ncbi:SAF domain-containing protein [Paenibacillus sp. PL91]|uniref:SAF domain-containing protein n=1 Tax=Paenibacillus sp. PL91 TaxID=2729538 RepID=UPI00145FBEB3|nr:SAF domain-containing protein [Paenibacillus sp. PL91]MBC9203520.1 SAF domain-containing protein [Paenibacillus sp. PL91]
MKRRRNAIISLTAAVLSASLVYGMYELQRIQIKKEETVAVLVPKRFIGAGERLKESDLEYQMVPQGAFVSDMVVKLEHAAGKEAVIPLGKGEPLLIWKVDDYYLQPKRFESTFQIPKEYIRSISNGIRAGDKVLLYASGESSPSIRLYPEAVTVASVKTSGNVEIDNMDNPNLFSLAEGNKEQMYASRREANGMIDYINVNLTEEQWLRLDSLCKSGELKLVVAYSPLSLELLAGGEADRS